MMEATGMPKEMPELDPKRLISQGQAVRNARRATGLTQTELGKRLRANGYRIAPTATRISRWENGRSPIPPLARPHLEAVLGIELPR